MPNRPYTFSLPDDVARTIDALPKARKSEFVAEAVRMRSQRDAQARVLTLLDEIQPQKGLSDKSAVELIQEARDARAQTLIHNVNTHE